MLLRKRPGDPRSGLEKSLWFDQTPLFTLWLLWLLVNRHASLSHVEMNNARRCLASVRAPLPSARRKALRERERVPTELAKISVNRVAQQLHKPIVPRGEAKGEVQGVAPRHYLIEGEGLDERAHEHVGQANQIHEQELPCLALAVVLSGQVELHML